MKKITFVIGILGKGGAERVVSLLASALAMNGYDVSLVMIYGNRIDYDLDSNIKVFPIICKNKIKILRPFERFKNIRQIITKINPDCVISFLADVNIHVLLSCLGLKYPILVSERNDPYQDPEYIWMRKLRDLLYKTVDGIVFQTNDAKDYFRNILKQNVVSAVIPNPIKENLPFYQSKNANPNRFITACRLFPQKNLTMMIDSVNELIKEGYECSLDIYGDGYMKDYLQEYINTKSLNSNVTLKGFSNDIHKEMLSSGCFLISSNYEGISNSMLEALAIGLPVISTDSPIGGAKMFIKNRENGILTSVGNTNEFTKAMRFMLLNRNEAIAFGEKACKIREILNLDNILQQWLSIINTLLK